MLGISEKVTFIDSIEELDVYIQLGLWFSAIG